MDNKVCRIHRWLTTGEHIFEADFADHKAIGSTTGSDNSCQSPDAKEGSVSECSSEVLLADLKSEPEEVDLLVGVEDDPLIPSPDEICHTLRKGQKVWHGYVIRAYSLPSGYLLAGSLDPYILLQKIPALPQDLPRKRSIRGEAIWKVASPGNDEGDWDPEYVRGAQKDIPLSVSKPTQLRISSGSAFHFNNERPDLIAILIPLWSYIFSIRFLELQRRSIQYSPTSLSPVLVHNIEPRPGNIVLHLGCASRGLVRWLAAVLAPSMGWLVTGPLPPWAAHYSEDTRFVIATDIPCAFLPSDSPPSSHEAADLLIEFCTLFGLGSSLVSCENAIEIVPQPTAAFLAVLMVPLYGRMGLQPQLSMPRMAKTQSTLVTPPNYVRDYINDLSYFMTLSIHPDFLGSIIWSIFWEPGLDCNLVSAWFGSILEVLSPIIRAGDTEMLVKIFTARRQSPALLWAGAFLLGDMRFLQKIISYLETHDEQPGGSWSRPDVDVAVWTGSKQSFLDEDCSGPYRLKDAQVPRSDLVRHRFNFRLGDPDILRYGWQPMGYVIKDQVERELWQWLETGRSREYEYWVWWLPRNDKKGFEYMVPEYHRGFVHDKARSARSCTDISEQEDATLAIPDELDYKVSLGPSRDATFSVISFGSKDATGDRSLEAMGPELRKHPWLADSRGI